MASALAAYRAGDGAPLGAYLADRGSIVQTADPDDSVARIVDAWLADRDSLIVTLGSNLRRDEIGDAVARRLLEAGELSPRFVATP